MEKFVDRMKRTTSTIRSYWFGRPKEELEGWIERGRAIKEIEGSAGYQLIVGQTEREIQWAQDQLESCKESELMEYRSYLKALRFLKDFLLTTERNADISSSVLSGRPGAIARDTVQFVRSVAPQERNAGDN
jgi:hypothetical protein